MIRVRRGLTQTALSKLPGAPDFRTLSHWEARRKVPSLRLLQKLLTAVGLDFRDLQDVLDQLAGRVGGSLDRRLAMIEGRLSEAGQQLDRTVETVVEVERRVVEVERRVAEVEGGGDLGQRIERLETLAGLLPRAQRSEA